MALTAPLARRWKIGVLKKTNKNGGELDKAIRREHADVQRSLAIKPVWLAKILKGEKTLEIRGKQHSFAGEKIFLHETGSGLVKATATLQQARELTEIEKVQNGEALKATHYEKPWAWPLEDITVLEMPFGLSPEARCYCPTWVPRRRWERHP